MSLITCGSIHQVHEWFSWMMLEEDEICMCLAALLCGNLADSRIEVPSYRSSPSS